ncbi:MAG: amino acid adenylation domain-containing protein [Candidatus Promineifilaceae bacterium]
MPRTSSGKFQRRACRQAFLDGQLEVLGEWRSREGSKSDHAGQLLPGQPGSGLPGPGQPRVAAPTESGDNWVGAAEIAAWLTAHLAAMLDLPARAIDSAQPLVDFGLDSVQAVELVAALETWLDRPLSATLVWDYPTIDALAGYLAASPAAPEQVTQVEAAPVEAAGFGREPVAVIGIGCRFPGVEGPDAFWQALRDGRDLIRQTPEERWEVNAYYQEGAEPQPGKTNTRWGGFLDGVDQFDAAFFGISPREAARMDPQQRLLLETAWQAIEHAAVNPASLAGSKTGVFIGISSYDYSRLQFSRSATIDAYAGTGNAHSIAANRLSYTLDLRGPSLAVDTACSSSLVATHMAMRSLREGESDLALAGGVNLILGPELSIAFSQARMLAADGRCKTFDAAADGYVRGEGCGVLLLKRLADAQRDGDPILAVLRGSAVNQDGRSNGLTAPSGLAQQAVIRAALADAGVDAAAIGALEAHGTGTRLGDPIEVHALQAVFDQDHDAPPLPVGSVKTNAGHLEAAAGVAGMIKIILALQQESLPPHLHLKRLNPHINLDKSRLVIDGQARSWPRAGQPRLAGVSSFGFGGTNAHIVVQEAPEVAGGKGQTWHGQVASGPRLLLLSARDEKALGELASAYGRFLDAHPEINLDDFCYTANTGRSYFDYRLALAAETTAEMADALRNWASCAAAGKTASSPPVVFLFTGQGAQYAGMGRRLYESEPVFRAVIDQCEAILQAEEGWSLREVIGQVQDQEQARGAGPSGAAIDDTTYTQPALFAVEVALARLWRFWGIEPAAVIGHSVGEFAAAVEAGILSLEEGLRLVAARGRLMGGLPRAGLPQAGRMAAVFAPAHEVEPLIVKAGAAGVVEIAAYNAPDSVVISGAAEAVSAVLAALETAGIETRPLAVSHAFHSPLMGPILEKFEAVASTCNFQAPRLPFASNLSGDLLHAAPDALYWREHVRRPVRFAEGMAAVMAAVDGEPVLLEIGPQPHLSGLARRMAVDALAILPSLRQGQDDWAVMLETLGRLFTLGATPDTGRFYAGRDAPGPARRRIALPTYPFQRQRFWLEADTCRGIGNRIAADFPAGHGSELLRLPTAVPVFEARLPAMPSETALRAHLIDVARAFWGDGDHELSTWQPAGGSLGEAEGAAGTLRVQTTLGASSNEGASFQLFGYEEAAGTWALLAAGELRRQQGAEAPITSSAARPAEALREPAPDIAAGTADLLPARPADLHSAAPEARQALLQRYLQATLGQILGMDAVPLPLDRPLDSLGLDSLMALELKNRLESELDLAVGVADLLRGPAIGELAQALASRAEGTAPPAAPPLAPVTIPGEPGPLSHGQQAMWLLQQLLPPDLALNVAGAARLSGPLDSDALQRALDRLVAQTGALRTVFTVDEDGARPLQVVQDSMAVPLEQVEAVGWEETAVEQFLQREAYRPFDLGQGPLLRLVLLQTAEARGGKGAGGAEYALLFSVCHLVTDFWSMALLVQDLYRFYLAEAQLTVNSEQSTEGTENLERGTGNGERGTDDWRLAAEDRQLATGNRQLGMADYARWQAELLESEVGRAQRDYWLGQLDGELPRLNLPTDRPRPVMQTYEGDTVSRPLPPRLVERLAALCQAEGVTLATALLAAFQTLLHRYSGQDDLLVGMVLNGRGRAALQSMVGYLINPVAQRANFSGDPTFLAFLQQARQRVLGAMDHQDYPLPLLAAELAADGRLALEPGRPPLFETLFIMQRAGSHAGLDLGAFALGTSGARLQAGDLIIESRPLQGLPAQFDLTLMVSEVGAGLTAVLHYNTDLFDASTMSRMLIHLETLLAGVIEDPARPVSQLPLLPPDEEQRLLRDWNDTAAPYPRHKRLHQLVFEQAGRTPQARAITFGATSWSYAELAARAADIAAQLDALGVGEGALVGLYLERSPDMVAALLGILQVGAAYVPLDPDFPAERLQLMIEDAQPAAMVTQWSLVNSKQLTVNNEQLTVNNQHATVNGESLPVDGSQLIVLSSQFPVPGSQFPVPSSEFSGAAYVIYTSGSTGRPKGVVISHQAAVNFLWSMRHEPGMNAAGRLLAVTTLSFDIALLELLLPLICGAEVVIAAREEAMDGERLAALLEEHAITLMQATPATWRLLLDAGWAGSKALTILCGGEALAADLAAKLLPRCRALWNMYGPTETTVWSTIAPVSAAGGPPPIGRPIANTQVYLLDDNLLPVPTGAVGQLYIGGDGVAEGYWRQPEQTAERFLPDPWAAGEPSSKPRMYRTGDLARYLPDGNLLHLGRNDFQVKVRGYRIELGDIETAVSRHPAVARNVTVAQDAAGGDTRLVTYWTAEAGQPAPTPAELRVFLQPLLPDYMLPAVFVRLEELPRTPNGKIDRRALPQPPATREAVSAGYVAPRNELERELAELCASALALERVGVFDNFFELGGNSLAAARLVFQARERFGVPIPLRLLFQQPTVAGLGRIVAEGLQAPVAQAGENGHGSNGYHVAAWGEMTREVLQEAARAVIEAYGFSGAASHGRVEENGHGEEPGQVEAPRTVLLTGATGFLGAFLLRDLLADTEAAVICLVRADDAAQGLARIKETQERYAVWNEAQAHRITALPGDLTRPSLGLSEAAFASLATTVDAIYHNGAMVNFVYDYKAHEASNVLATGEILRLAGARPHGPAPVHFVSTLSVFHDGRHAQAGCDTDAIYRENSDLDALELPFGGYAQSKWVAEKLVLAAMAHGRPAAIYRPGLIGGDSERGAWNTGDLMSAMALACAAAGAAPELQAAVDIAPVDYVSRAIVTLAGRPAGWGKAYHLSNPQPAAYQEVLSWAAAAGLPLATMPFEAWRLRLASMVRELGGGPWQAFLPLLEEVSADQIFMPAIECRQAQAGLAAAAVERGEEPLRCPPVDARLFATYFEFFQRNQGLTVNSERLAVDSG